MRYFLSHQTVFCTVRLPDSERETNEPLLPTDIKGSSERVALPRRDVERFLNTKLPKDE